MTVLAVREEGRVYATTATSFAPVSAEPPRVLASLGASAQVLPFLKEGRAFVVNLLSWEQRRLASIFADAYPVGPSPFPETGEPELAESLVSLRCTVDEVVPLDGGVRLVLATVTGTRLSEDQGVPLVRHRRGYHPLA